MKISTFLSGFIVVSMIFIVAGLIIQDVNTNFPESNIDTSEWEGKYDYIADINNSIAPLQSNLEDLGDEDKGWFSKISTTIAAIPLAVIQIPIIIGKAFLMAGSLIVGTLRTFGTPQQIILALSALIIVWGIFRAIEIFQRWDI